MLDENNPPRAGDQPLHEPLPDGFEPALAELETLAARMGEADMGLEESLALYQRGVALARVCRQRLQDAETRVQVLQDQLLEPFAADDSQAAS